MDYKNVIYSQSGILISSEKWKFVIPTKMNIAGNSHSKWGNPDSWKQIACFL